MAVETLPPQVLQTFDTLPNWQMVAGENEKLTRNHQRRILQIPESTTAAEFWHMYQPEKIDVQMLVPDFPKLTASQLAQLIPDTSWYPTLPNGDNHAESLHGRPHATRVALYTRVIAAKEKLSKKAIKLFDATSLLHDLGRENDTIDADHGQRSVDV